MWSHSRRASGIQSRERAGGLGGATERPSAQRMPDFLLEVGSEEMPASWLAGLTEQLRERLTDLLAREHLAATSLTAFSTPRRLVVSAQLPARQPDREEKV